MVPQFRPRRQGGKGKRQSLPSFAMSILPYAGADRHPRWQSVGLCTLTSRLRTLQSVSAPCTPTPAPLQRALQRCLQGALPSRPMLPHGLRLPVRLQVQAAASCLGASPWMGAACGLGLDHPCLTMNLLSVSHYFSRKQVSTRLDQACHSVCSSCAGTMFDVLI